MDRGLVVGQGSYRKQRLIKVLWMLALAGIGLALWPAPKARGCLGRNGEVPSFGGSKPNPKMAARLRDAQAKRNLNGINLPGLPPIRGTHPTVFILIESTTATLPWWNPLGASAAPFNPRFSDPAKWVGLRQELDKYYNEVSQGNLRVGPAQENFGTVNDGIIGPISIPDLNSLTSQTLWSDYLAWEAVMAANPYINYSSFDVNMDGQLDSDELHIVIFQSGYEASFNPNTPGPNTWAHMMPGSPYPPFYLPDLDSDNVVISSYLYLGSELWFPNAPSEMTRVGTIAHEFGHDLGLPDLYDTDPYNGYWGGLGWHSLMAGGAWGDDARKPVHLDGFLKSYMFWGNETDVMAPTNQTFTLPASMGSNSLVRVNIPNSQEFFIIENRQHYGFDQGLPGTLGGLAIYHCDSYWLQKIFFDYNIVNDYPYDPGIQIMQADGSNSMILGVGTLAEWGSDKDYFRIGNNTTFNRLTNPASLLKNGLPSNVEISDVSASGPVMTFRMNHGNTFSFPSNSINVHEEAGQASVIVNLDRPAENEATIEYAAVGSWGFPGQATPYTAATKTTWDFHLPTGVLTFEPGSTSKYFNILLNNDSIYDPGESIKLLLRNPKGAILNNALSTMTVNIIDNDKLMLNLIKPNGGTADNVMRGDTRWVQWTAQNGTGPEVRIDLFKDDAYYITLPGCYHVANDGLTTVTFPTYLPVDTRYRLAVTSVSDESYNDESDDYFSILDPNMKVLAVIINGGITPANSRRVNLEIRVPQGLQFVEYMASESSSFAGASWLPFNASTQFTLTSPGDGYKRVWLKIRNSGGQESAPLSGVTVLQEIKRPPLIETLPAQTIYEFQAYTGPRPKLLAGGDLPPINWSLVSGPPGMTIDPMTGVVAWKNPKIENSPAQVTIRATNPVGSGTMKWTLTVQPGDLGRAVDYPQWTWTTSGNAGWYYQTSLTHDGSDAARTRPIGNAQKAVMSTTVTGPGMLSFYWKVSSEQNFDKLSFNLNSSKIREISGEVAWTNVSVAVPVGTYTLSWTYAKDTAGAAGSDAAWVDEVTWQQGLRVTNITRTGYTATTMGSGKTLYGDDTDVFNSPVPVIYNGQVMIRTQAKDRNYSGAQMLGFYVDRPVRLILALDSRFATLPSWATGYVKMGTSLQSGTVKLNLYTRTYPAGKIVLGGPSDNRNPNNYNMYSVILMPSAPVAVSGINLAGYVASSVEPGWGVMTDKSYTFSSPVPVLYDGARVIRTKQADTTKAGNSFLRFKVTQPVTVLLGLDSARTTPPAWAAGWQYYGERITATDGSRKLWGKRFAPGTITLGGNVDPGVTTYYKMYSVIVLPNN